MTHVNQREKNLSTDDGMKISPSEVLPVGAYLPMNEMSTARILCRIDALTHFDQGGYQC
jgi:hypothetical protein